jgi:hypothetical protein
MSLRTALSSLPLSIPQEPLCEVPKTPSARDTLSQFRMSPAPLPQSWGAILSLPFTLTACAEGEPGPSPRGTPDGGEDTPDALGYETFPDFGPDMSMPDLGIRADIPNPEGIDLRIPAGLVNINEGQTRLIEVFNFLQDPVDARIQIVAPDNWEALGITLFTNQTRPADEQAFEDGRIKINFPYEYVPDGEDFRRFVLTLKLVNSNGTDLTPEFDIDFNVINNLAPHLANQGAVEDTWTVGAVKYETQLVEFDILIQDPEGNRIEVELTRAPGNNNAFTFGPSFQQFDGQLRIPVSWQTNQGDAERNGVGQWVRTLVFSAKDMDGNRLINERTFTVHIPLYPIDADGDGFIGGSDYANERSIRELRQVPDCAPDDPTIMPLTTGVLNTLRPDAALRPDAQGNLPIQDVFCMPGYLPRYHSGNITKPGAASSI